MPHKYAADFISILQNSSNLANTMVQFVLPLFAQMHCAKVLYGFSQIPTKEE